MSEPGSPSPSTRLFRERLAVAGRATPKPRLIVALGFAWIEVLVAAAGSDECFELAQNIRRFVRQDQ